MTLPISHDVCMHEKTTFNGVRRYRSKITSYADNSEHLECVGQVAWSRKHELKVTSGKMVTDLGTRPKRDTNHCKHGVQGFKRRGSRMLIGKYFTRFTVRLNLSRTRYLNHHQRLPHLPRALRHLWFAGFLTRSSGTHSWVCCLYACEQTKNCRSGNSV